jgi:hypothetical protein
MKKARSWEEEYDRMRPGSAEFLRKNKHNFSYRSTRWKKLRLESKKRPSASPNCYGVLVVELLNEKEQVLNLVGEGTLEQGAQMLSRWMTVAVPMAEGFSGVPTLEQAQVDAAHAAKVQMWLFAIVNDGMLVMSVRLCFEMRSPLGLWAMLLAPKLYVWVDMFYMAFFGQRESAARIRLNRSQKPPL